MKKTIENKALFKRERKVYLLFMLLMLAVTIFLLSVVKTIASDRRIPSQNATIHDRSLRGSIVSSDNYTLSYSQKTHKAVIRAESIDPDKKDLFITLFSIYSNVPKDVLKKAFKDRNGKEKKGNVVLCKNLNEKEAMQLKSLAHKLQRLRVFRATTTSKGIRVVYGLDIIENSEHRFFPKADILSPILGYVGKSNGKYIRPIGKKGLEAAYEKHIVSKKNGLFRGKRDVSSTIIHDKNSINKRRVDGLDLHLNISLAFQQRLEIMIDKIKREINAEEILVGVMQSNTGKVLGMATTLRYKPSHIKQKDIPALVPKFTEYPYEAGSVIKPLSLAIALDHGKVSPQSIFNTYNGRLKIGKKSWITDDEKFPSLTATDIIVHSSNVGISQIAWRLTGQEFREGLLKLGVAKPSGIDLTRDLPGALKPIHILNHKLHRANTSYGYGMMVTFAQLLKAYSAFNNDGIAVTPRLVDYLEDAKGNHYTLDPDIPDSKATKKTTARQIHTILKEVVKRGTGKKAQYQGLEIGGKTGTAHIAKNGHYIKSYHSSFYGFANDDQGNKYTIGVLVIKAKYKHTYFASQSAVPTFRRTLDILVELGYLKPEGGVIAPVGHTTRVPMEQNILPMHKKRLQSKKTSKRAKETKHKKRFKVKRKSIKELFRNTNKKRKVHKKHKIKHTIKKKRAKKVKTTRELFQGI